MDPKKIELYQALLQKKRLKGLEDLFFFNKYIIEQDPERRKFIVPHVHSEWAEWFSASTKRIQCILVPRSCFKTTFFTVGWSLQSVVKSPSVRILIANATLDNAQKFLGEIGSHFQGNEEFKQLYGEFYNKDLRWNENEIVVAGRRAGIREPTISVAGVGGNLVSRHFDIIIGDDLVNAENSATRLQSDKVIDWWKRSLSLLEPNGKMLLIGTRWAYFELYSYLQDNMRSEVDFYIRGAHNPDGSLYFPERFSETKLKELKKLHGSYIYSCFYNNEPIDEEEAIIKKSQIRYYETAPDGLNVFSACDPAISQGGLADQSAYVTVGVASTGDWYVLEARQEKSTVSEMIESLFIQNNQWRPLTSCIETIGQAQGLLEPIHNEEERRKIYLPLLEIKALPQVTKEMRIRSILQPRFERGSVYIKRDMVELEDQLLKFPRAKKDDLVDALSMIESIAYEPGVKTSVDNRVYDSKLEEQLNKPSMFERFADEVMGDEF
jgi:phage terminase large subunit-like protein